MVVSGGCLSIWLMGLAMPAPVYVEDPKFTPAVEQGIRSSRCELCYVRRAPREKKDGPSVRRTRKCPHHPGGAINGQRLGWLDHNVDRYFGSRLSILIDSERSTHLRSAEGVGPDRPAG